LLDDEHSDSSPAYHDLLPLSPPRSITFRMALAEDLKAQVAKLRADANKLYDDGDYDGARATYSRGIELDPTNAVLYANRAQANLSMKK
jgi:tetratricopeptide (TPR) repeat protein